MYYSDMRSVLDEHLEVAHLSKTKRATKGKGDEMILRADSNLFARTILITESSQLRMKDLLEHPLRPLPASLASSKGLSAKTNKEQLGRELV